MPINRLAIDSLRNLSQVNLEPCPDVNLIYGDNGSGKTSLLESVFMLGRGRGFKQNKYKNLIQQGRDRCVVFGQVEPMMGGAELKLGVSRSRDGQHEIKLQGEPVKNIVALAELLPIQTIDPDAFRLLDAGPQYRRQFIDWGVFHVEHTFFKDWQAFNRCLKQRNKLLRHARIADSERRAWDREFAQIANKINDQRQAYVDRLLPVFQQLLADLTDLSEDVEIRLYPGWDQRKASIDEYLQLSLERDIKQGFSHYGPQRADLRIKYQGVLANDILSRGQKKLVVCALKLAQGLLFSQGTGRSCIFLIDDLAAELDERHRTALCQLLAGMNCQVFITSVDRDSIPQGKTVWGDKTRKMFHVKHGEIIAEQVESVSGSPAEQPIATQVTE